MIKHGILSWINYASLEQAFKEIGAESTKVNESFVTPISNTMYYQSYREEVN